MQGRRTTIAKLIAAVSVFNLVVVETGAWLADEEAPPIPEQVVGPEGDVILTGQEIRDRKRAFQRNRLITGRSWGAARTTPLITSPTHWN